MQNNESTAAKDTAAIRRKGLTYILLTVFFIAVSYLSFLFVSQFFGDGEIFLSFKFLTAPVVTGLCALLVAFFALDSLRFYFVLRTLGVQISYFYIVKLSFINMFVSAITPFATGGGFAQIYFLARKKVPLGSATAASTIRTLLAVAFFLIAAPVVLIWNPSLLEIIGSGFAGILIATVVIYCAIVIFLFWVIGNEKRMKRGMLRLTRFLKRKHIISPQRARKICLGSFREVRNFNTGVKLFLGGKKRHIVLSVLFTVMFLVALFSFPVLLTAAMDNKISPVWIYQAQTIITFITYFAFTPGAAGIAEGGFAMLFKTLVGEGDIGSLTLLWRFFTVYFGALVGLAVFYIEIFLLSRNGGKLKKTEG